MQIPCPELYEREKKQNEGKSIGELYHQVYKLGDDPCLRYHNWKYTNFIFDSTVENILVYFHYEGPFVISDYELYIEKFDVHPAEGGDDDDA